MPADVGLHTDGEEEELREVVALPEAATESRDTERSTASSDAGRPLLPLPREARVAEARARSGCMGRKTLLGSTMLAALLCIGMVGLAPRLTGEHAVAASPDQGIDDMLVVPKVKPSTDGSSSTTTTTHRPREQAKKVETEDAHRGPRKSEASAASSTHTSTTEAARGGAGAGRKKARHGESAREATRSSSASRSGHLAQSHSTSAKHTEKHAETGHEHVVSDGGHSENDVADRRGSPRHDAPGDSPDSSFYLQQHNLKKCDSDCEESSRSAPGLVAYWDVDTCGPKGDDYNAHWCGGHKETPVCQEEVEVNDTVCVSRAARLVLLNVSKPVWWGRELVEIDDCRYMFFAHYECVPTTTTTTNTGTSTTSTTTSRTSTTSTTTTTVETEAMFKHRLKTRFPEPADFSCAKACPTCTRSFERPKPGQLATDLNGVQLPDVCFEAKGLHKVFVIGDWGGIIRKSGGVSPADHRRPNKFAGHTRPYVAGVDDCAQQRVAAQMQARASWAHPDYILNVGDNFYWGGVNDKCGQPAWRVMPSLQFQHVFEEIYHGPGIDGKQWLGVLGNHDYGGYKFNAAWDQAISYTWGQSGRWLTPAQYWRVKVHYPGFSVDYFFADTNVFDAEGTGADPGHNLCNQVHNLWNTSCGAEGPSSLADCPGWFQRLWASQSKWLEDGLAASTADWQIIVTHFPPKWGLEYWTDMVERHGIDLIVSGHAHNQELHHFEDGNWLRPTAWIVSGGGGGITSEGIPDPAGHDDQYGFFELTLSAKEIEIQAISHGGVTILQTFLVQRFPAGKK